ncbi:MAG TPA: glycosyltransferase [Steroidobacteraceae bacterium]|nr:glycosyltransferase [Steroidobacteraceae bacterium]
MSSAFDFINPFDGRPMSNVVASQAPARAPGVLRVLHVVPTYYPATRYGGPIRSVHGLTAALARRGHDVHVYTTSADGSDDLDVPLDRPVDLDNVSIHYFRIPALRRLFWAPDLARKVRQSAGSFDVVHLHSVFLCPTWAAARAATRAGVPYVLTPRGMLIRELIRRKSRFAKTAWIELVERRTIARAAAVHVTAELEADELRGLGLKAASIACIPNGVEWPAEFAPRSDGPFASIPELYALFLSRINWKKGLDRLIEAWRWVPDIPLVIAGNDEENYLPQMQALARSLGIADRVLAVGPVSDEHKWALYKNARVFLLPSYSENFGNVVAEAMAMGCPVVVTPEVGISTLVRAEGAGVVTDGEPQVLARAVRELLADPTRRREMGARGEAAARSKLSWDGIAAEIERLYRCSVSQR